VRPGWRNKAANGPTRREEGKSTVLDMILKVAIEIACAAIVLYVLLRES
jgi:hypothetical protein